MSSLALTDGLLCLVTLGLAARSGLPVGYRAAFALMALPAFLGVLRFSELYPLLAWHQLFSIMGASAALPLLAVCVRWPDSWVAQKKQFTLLFLGTAMLAGLLIAGLGALRIYDQAAALLSMLVMFWVLRKAGALQRAAGAALMLLGSALFVAKVGLEPWLLPGDFLHLGLALGCLLLAPVSGLRRGGLKVQAG